MDNRINVNGATLDDIRREGNHDIAVCRTREGQTLQFPIDQQYLQQFRDNKGQELNLEVICHWPDTGGKQQGRNQGGEQRR